MGVLPDMNPTRSPFLLPLTTLLLTAACGQPPDEDPAPSHSASSPLLATGARVERGNCTDTEIKDAQLTAFAGMVEQAMERGRAAVNSAAFRSCLQAILVDGNVTMPHEAPDDQTGWGPYCPPGDFPGTQQGCGDMTTRDAHWDRLGADGLSLNQLRRFYAKRAAIEAHSPNPITIRCETGNGTAFVDEPWGEDRAGREGLHFSAQGMKNALARNASPDPQVREAEFIGQAAIYWHEVMHVHGYDHDRGNRERQRDQIPHAVGACVLDVLTSGNELRNSGACAAVVPCSKRGYPVPSTFQDTLCTCAADPAFPAAPARTRTFPGLTSAPTIVVDSFDERVLRMDPGGSTFVFSGRVWAPQPGTSSEVYAGGSVLLRRGASGEVLRAINGGTWANLGTAGPNSLAVDDIGTVYRRSATKVDMYRVGGSGWQTIGGTSGVIIAGGDHFFATDPADGRVWRYRHESNNWSVAGGASAWLAVDAFGTLYGLAPNKLSISRNRGGDTWEAFGGDAQYLVASARFYARGLNNEQLWRRFPNGQWTSVGTCTNATAGGTSVWCVNRDGGNNWRIDAFERD
jgi:hypothetical protein